MVGFLNIFTSFTEEGSAELLTLSCWMWNQLGLHFIFLLKFIYFIYLFLAAWGLCCCVQAFSSFSERGLFSVVVCGLLIVVASFVAEHGL